MNSQIMRSELIKIAIAVVFACMLVSGVNAELPDPGMQIHPGNSALLVTDPQNGFLRIGDEIKWT